MDNPQRRPAAGRPIHSTYWCLLFCLILALALPGRVRSEQRELDGGQTAGTDAVLLLDASGSMRLTDPDRLRDEGARLFTEFLREGDRVAVIEFAEESKVIRPLSPFSAEKGEELFRDITRVGNSGLYTDILDGVKTAKAMLEASLKKGSAGIIIVLSDGKHDPDPKKGELNQSLDQLFYSELPDLKDQGIKVYTLAFSEQADRDLLSKMSLATDALSWYTPSSEDIHQSFADLFLAVKKPQIVPLSSKGFKIDGQVKEATFYINNEKHTEELNIISPSGKTITRADHGENVKWFTGKKFDVITIDNPEVGAWQLVGLPKEEAFATILTDLKLVTDWGGNIVEGEAKAVQARLYEGEKPVVLPAMTGVSNYLLQVVPTDRVSEPIIREILNDEGKGGDKISHDGIFSINIKIDTPGEYKLKVLARSPTFERSQQIPFRVKKRLVSLEIVDGSTSHGGGHGDSHGDHSSGHDDHGGGAQSADSHGGGHDDHGDSKGEDAHGDSGTKVGGENDHFQITLAQEAVTFKKIELKLTATDGARKTYKLPVHKSAENPLVYEVPASLLPADGSYSLVATLQAQDRNRRTVSARSKTLTYLRSASGQVPGHEIQVVAVEHGVEPVAEEEPASIIPSLLLILVVNLAVGAGCAFLLKKSQASINLSIPEYQPSEELLSAIKSLEARSKETEVNFEDPRFQTDSYIAAPAAAAEAVPSQGAEAKAEDSSDGGGEAPAEEDESDTTGEAEGESA